MQPEVLEPVSEMNWPFSYLQDPERLSPSIRMLKSSGALVVGAFWKIDSHLPLFSPTPRLRGAQLPTGLLPSPHWQPSSMEMPLLLT